MVARARREGWPPRAAWPGIVTSGMLWFGVYMVALNWGEQKVDAGTAAIVVSSGPIIIALLSGWRLREGFPRGVLAGLAVAFAGVIVVGVATAGSGHASVAGVLLCLLAALAFAIAVVSQKPALRYASALQVTTFGAALARTPAAKMGATTYLVPAITVLVSWALLGQVPSGLAILGGALCLAGVALSRRRPHAPAKREPAPSLE